MQDWRRPAAALLATMLCAGALRAFVSGVYNGNLNALGLTWTAALPLLLVLPVALRGEARPWLRAGAVALAVGRIALPWVPAGNAYLVVSGLAALAALVTLAALLSGADTLVACGIVAGFAADVALVAWGRSWDATLASPVLVAPLAVLLVALAWPLRPAPAGEAPRPRFAALVRRARAWRVALPGDRDPRQPVRPRALERG
jgi:hypothetical protein